jgi:hypothetical protein
VDAAWLLPADDCAVFGMTMKKVTYDFMGKRFTYHVSDNAKRFTPGYFAQGETMTLRVDGKAVEPSSIEKISHNIELPAERLEILDS